MNPSDKAAMQHDIKDILGIIAFFGAGALIIAFLVAFGVATRNIDRGPIQVEIVTPTK